MQQRPQQQQVICSSCEHQQFAAFSCSRLFGVQQQGAQYLWAEEGTCARGVSNVSSLAARVCAGVVKSTKMTRTIVVRRDYLHYIKKYARCEHIPTSDPQMLKSAITVGGCAGGHLLATKVVLIRH